MKLIIDMNLSPMWKAVFEESGHDAEHWINVGEPTSRDEEILAWAVANNAVLFTNDLDFGAILAASHAKAPSVLQVRDEDLMPSATKDIVLNAIAQFERELKEGAIVVLEPWRNRCRILPLKRD